MARRQHRVTVCAAIAEAEEFLGGIVDASLAPNMVVSDIRLPDGDGITFYFRQARRFPGMRWNLMSGNHDLVRIGNDFRVKSDLPGYSIVDKPILLRLRDRFIQNSRQAA
jgi:DNA-binding NtrC family response regulator